MVRIGVAGHRFLTEFEKLHQGIEHALEVIAKHYPPPYVMVSSLAEGADRIVVQRAMKRWDTIKLIVPLPLPVEDYIEDFDTPTSREEFNQFLKLADRVIIPIEKEKRPSAYVTAGLTMLNLSDLLLTVWDGKPAQSTGGTGDLVAAARKEGKPIAWVHAGNRLPGTRLPTSLGELQGQVSFENFSEDMPLD